MNSRPLSRLLRPHAFSLVEVTMAIGIVSFALLSILGTFSVGLTTIKDAKKDLTHAQIIAQLTSDTLQTPFEKITPTGDFVGPFFFDQSGRRVTASTGALYQAKLTVTPGGVGTYPGALAGLDRSAKNVKIVVTSLAAEENNKIYTSDAVVLVPKS